MPFRNVHLAPHWLAGLEKRLRRELGQKKTSWDLQEILLGKQAGAGADSGSRPSTSETRNWLASAVQISSLA